MKKPKYYGTETDLQRTIAKYLDMMGVLWNHSPNETMGTPAHYKKRASMGVKSGFPDVMIFEARKGFHGLAIELKVGRNKPTPAQLQWIEWLNERGYHAVWLNDLDEIIAKIDWYFENE